MIVGGDRFEGDDEGLARAQHDIYWDAFILIPRGCRFHVEHACLTLGKSIQEVWPDTAIDHRTLQDAHDFLAAVWRFKSLPALATARRTGTGRPSMNQWLAWLKAEVAAWRDDPHLVRCVMTICNNQNSKPGYAAEEELLRHLLGRFKALTWIRREPDKWPCSAGIE